MCLYTTQNAISTTTLPLTTYKVLYLTKNNDYVTPYQKVKINFNKLYNEPTYYTTTYINYTIVSNKNKNNINSIIILEDFWLHSFKSLTDAITFINKTKPLLVDYQSVAIAECTVPQNTLFTYGNFPYISKNNEIISANSVASKSIIYNSIVNSYPRNKKKC